MVKKLDGYKEDPTWAGIIVWEIPAIDPDIGGPRLLCHQGIMYRRRVYKHNLLDLRSPGGERSGIRKGLLIDSSPT